MKQCQFDFEEAKSIITKSKLPDTDYVINPYIGCEFGCIYCYASFMGRFVNKKIDDWGKYVVVKRNSENLINKELAKLERTSPNAKILLSSVTDPYQPVEVKYRITRGILNTIATLKYKGMVNILTKSPLVLRDVEIIKSIPQIEVGLTITTTDDELSKAIEVYAPKASVRLKALSKLNKLGIDTYAFVGPLMPHYAVNPNLLDQLFSAIKDTGTKSIYVEYLNTRRYIKDRMVAMIENNPLLSKVYTEDNYFLYEQELKTIVLSLVKKYNFNLKLNKVILHHNDLK